jgi:hypothetical protein
MGEIADTHDCVIISFARQEKQTKYGSWEENVAPPARTLSSKVDDGGCISFDGNVMVHVEICRRSNRDGEALRQLTNGFVQINKAGSQFAFIPHYGYSLGTGQQWNTH